MDQSSPGHTGEIPKLSSETTPMELKFFGSGLELFTIIMRNICLILFSMGLYFAWAKTWTRKFYWQNLSLNGQRFFYYGTPKELLRGYLIVFAIYGLSIFPLKFLSGFYAQLGAWVMGLYLLVGLLCFPFVLISARRYLLSRTGWRGIRFSMDPIHKAYAKTFFLGVLASVFTLGLYYPIFRNKIFSLAVNSTYWGDQKFSYKGQDRDVMILFIKYLPLMFLTFGLAHPFYKAELIRYRSQHTSLGELEFFVDIKGWELLAYYVLLFIALPNTLGLAYAWIKVFKINFFCQRIQVFGDMEFHQVRQRVDEASATGDGWSEAMNVSVGI